MTKNEIKAQLQLMISFSQCSRIIGDCICQNLAPDGDDELYDLMTEIQDGESNWDDISSKFENLNCLKEQLIEDGKPVATQYVNIENNTIEVGVKYPDGEKLENYLLENDETFQAGSVYYPADNGIIDLISAEIKKGEFAKIFDLPQNNKDINLYVWSNPNSEDFTHKFSISHADIMQAMSEN